MLCRPATRFKRRVAEPTTVGLTTDRACGSLRKLVSVSTRKVSKNFSLLRERDSMRYPDRMKTYNSKRFDVCAGPQVRRARYCSPDRGPWGPGNRRQLNRRSIRHRSRPATWPIFRRYGVDTSDGNEIRISDFEIFNL